MTPDPELSEGFAELLAELPGALDTAMKVLGAEVLCMSMTLAHAERTGLRVVSQNGVRMSLDDLRQLERRFSADMQVLIRFAGILETTQVEVAVVPGAAEGEPPADAVEAEQYIRGPSKRER